MERVFMHSKDERILCKIGKAKEREGDGKGMERERKERKGEGKGMEREGRGREELRERKGEGKGMERERKEREGRGWRGKGKGKGKVPWEVESNKLSSLERVMERTSDL